MLEEELAVMFDAKRGHHRGDGSCPARSARAGAGSPSSTHFATKLSRFNWFAVSGRPVSVLAA